MNRINAEINSGTGERPRAGRAFIAIAVACMLVATLVGLAGQHAVPAYAASAASATLSTQSATYKIVFKLNGGKQASNQVTTIAKGKTLKVAKLKAPTRERYKFVGWYTNRALTAKATALKGTDDASQRTVYAKWKLTSYSILYNLNGGTFSGSYTKTVGKNKTVKASALEQPTRTGYTFVGWYADKDLKAKATKVQGVSDSAQRTLYAKWSPLKYVISYELNDGGFPGAYPTAYKPSKGLATLPVPERSGYAFIGWYANKALTDHVTSIPAGATGNKKLYARWIERITVAHRGYTAGGAAANSLEALLAAHDNGYTYVDVDVRFAADGTPVLATPDGRVPVKPTDDASGSGTPATDAPTTNPPATDASATDTPTTSTPTTSDSGTDAPAGDSGATDTPATEPSQGQQQDVYTEFATYLDKCKTYGMVPFVELPSDATQAQVEQLAKMVYDRRMSDFVYWMSPNTDQLGYTKKNISWPKLVLQAPEVTASATQSAEMLAKLGADVSIATDADHATASAVDACKAAGIPLGIWTLPADADRTTYDPYISTFAQ